MNLNASFLKIYDSKYLILKLFNIKIKIHIYTFAVCNILVIIQKCFYL